MHNKLIAVLIGLILLLGGGTAGAGELKADSQPTKVQKPSLPKTIDKKGTTDEYTLVMSKDDNMCQQMEKIYNGDLRKYGKLKYNQHEEFKAIKWEEKKYYRILEGKRDYPLRPYDTSTTVALSRFDINNDGKEEVVIKKESMLYGILTEDLFYFKDEDLANFNNKDGFDIKILYDRATGRVGGGAGFEGNTYELKELPKISVGIILDKETYSHPIVGGHFYLNPFRLKGSYYVDMKDEVPYDKYRVYSGKYLVILKFTEDNLLKDVCYFLKTSYRHKSKGGK
jgi:hypothetical protein